MTKKIGIIGSGISGLTCAYHLCGGNDIHVFEAASYIGGHTHTVDTEYRGEKSRIDTGFIVFNDRTYPNFIALMEKVGVDYQPTEMSFSVRNDSINLEYNGHSIASLFAQRSNLFNPAFYAMLSDILRFNKAVRQEKDPTRTIGQYLESENYSSLFRDNYLLPMISAIWSMGLDSCRDFPLQFFTRFFENHGLLDVTNRPQWYTIVGGSSEYIEPLTGAFADRIHLNTAARRVIRENDAVIIQTDDDTAAFDEVIFACHGDQALGLLDSPSNAEREVMRHFTFSDNRVILHTDTSLLPRRKGAWASWNYAVVDGAAEQTTLTYNMNILQRLNLKHTYLVSLNQEVADEYVLNTFSYSHPVYSLDALSSQQQWHRVSGADRIHYCGAYWFNGFHEDGVKSGLRVVDALEGNQ